MPRCEEHLKAVCVMWSLHFVRENRMHGLMREGRREPVLYSTLAHTACELVALITQNYTFSRDLFQG
jgi:hypothetical protein